MNSNRPFLCPPRFCPCLVYSYYPGWLGWSGGWLVAPDPPRPSQAPPPRHAGAHGTIKTHNLVVDSTDEQYPSFMEYSPDLPLPPPPP